MKLSLACLILFLAMTAGSGYAQRITLKKQQVSLQKIFKEIRKQTKYDFLYNAELLKTAKPLDVNLKNATVDQALDTILKSNSLHYEIEDKVVTITALEAFVQLKSIGYSISGIVKDKHGLALPGANVLLSGYQVGAVADSAGRFFLKSLVPGNYNLLVQMIGYVPITQNVVINNKARDVEVVMEESVKELTEVVVRPDPRRSEYLATFKENFIGTSVNAKKCVILNPQVIRFDYDEQRHILKASAEEFLIIENKALGYNIKYLLSNFQKDYETNVVHFYGYPYFEEFEKKEYRIKRYAKQRKTAYIGSPQHFFSALYTNTYHEQGFVINKLVKAPNTRKKPAEVIDERLKLLSEKMRNNADERRRKKSLIYWTEMKLLPDTVEMLIREEVPRYSLVQQKLPSLKTLEFKDALYIIFIKEKEPKDYTRYAGYKIKRPDDFNDFQVSLVYPLEKTASFYENGVLHNPESLLFEGMWGYEKVADLLPIDYVPPKM